MVSKMQANVCSSISLIIYFSICYSFSDMNPPNSSKGFFFLGFCILLLHSYSIRTSFKDCRTLVVPEWNSCSYSIMQISFCWKLLEYSQGSSHKDLVNAKITKACNSGHSFEKHVGFSSLETELTWMTLLSLPNNVANEQIRVIIELSCWPRVCVRFNCLVKKKTRATL